MGTKKVRKFISYDGLQLARIAESIFNHHLAHILFLGVIIASISPVIWEVNMSVLDDPAAMLSELNDISFGVEEQKRFRGANREARVSPFAAASDLRADLVLENLVQRRRKGN